MDRNKLKDIYAGRFDMGGVALPQPAPGFTRTHRCRAMLRMLSPRTAERKVFAHFSTSWSAPSK